VVEDPASVLDAIARAYAVRGIERYAIWVHESEADTAAAVRARGYARVGFRDLGRFDESVPGHRARSSQTRSRSSMPSTLVGS
jgi:hypothetical protein